MSQFSNIKSILLAGAALTIAACTQGSEIESPGATNPGTPPAGGGGGGGGGATASCPSGFAEVGVITAADPSKSNVTLCELSGTILSDLTLPFVANTAFRLDGRVDVGVDDGLAGGLGDTADLTIEPGVTIVGDGGADYLVVNRGSRILADGEENSPIIMTSTDDISRLLDTDDSNDAGTGLSSEWGGLVLLGQAPINECATGSVGVDCENIIEGVTAPEAIFGGNDSADDSGILRYVQVKFAGFDIDGMGNELNGISFGGVGTGTTVDYVQVYNNLDDGVEFFGGTVNVKHLALTGNFDDSMDTDLGWTGFAQYVLIHQRDGQGDNGFELSGDTNPTISNFTLVGDGSKAYRMNSGHVGRWLNGVVAHTAECFRWEDAGDDDASYDGVGVDPSFDSVLFDCDGGLTGADSTANGVTVAPLAIAGGTNNSTATPNTLNMMFLPGANELPPAPTTPFAASGLNMFFDDTAYIGAFSDTETATNNWTTGWSFKVFPDPECPTHPNISETDEKNGLKVCSISGTITTDLTLTRGNLYEIEGRVSVGIDDGLAGGSGTTAALTIEPGVTLFGNGGADYIVVNRGSQIFAEGTATNPIIFTSEDDVDGVGTAAERLVANAEWGGLVILGQAPINECATGSVGVDCENIIEGVTAPEAIFGGNDAGNDSGSLRYVQVKFAGFDIDGMGNELNGISFGGVGSGTEVEYVQVHNNLDDGVEFFGGTVNVKHLVLTGNFDDSMDTDLGWTGAAQFVLILQRDDATDQGDNGFELSGDTDPIIANFTVVGGGTNAYRMNSGHIGRWLNGVVAHDAECFRWEEAGDDDAAYDGVGIDPSFDSVLFDCDGGITAANSTANGMTVAPLAISGGSNNTTGTADTLVNGFINGTAESMFTEFPGSLNGLNGFLEDTTYIGAVEDSMDTWWQGWTCSLEAGSTC